MKTLHLRYLAPCVVVVCLSPAGHALGHQPDAPAPMGWTSSLELRINDSFSFDDLVGISVALKVHKNARWGWRLGLTPELTQTDRLGPDYNSRYRQRALYVEAQRLRYIGILERTRLCLGLGVIGGQERLTEAEGSGETDVFQRVKSETRAEIGLIATLSVEYTLAKIAVLGVEYGATVVWDNTRWSDKYWDADESDFAQDKTRQDGLRANSRKVAIILAILF